MIKIKPNKKFYDDLTYCTKIYNDIKDKSFTFSEVVDGKIVVKLLPFRDYILYTLLNTFQLSKSNIIEVLHILEYGEYLGELELELERHSDFITLIQTLASIKAELKTISN